MQRAELSAFPIALDSVEYREEFVTPTTAWRNPAVPIYEYTCNGCSHEFELLIRGSEKPKCPECGKGRLTKKFSVPAAHTHGSADACPVRETGMCDASSCQSGGCGLTGLS